MLKMGQRSVLGEARDEEAPARDLLTHPFRRLSNARPSVKTCLILLTIRCWAEGLAERAVASLVALDVADEACAEHAHPPKCAPTRRRTLS